MRGFRFVLAAAAIVALTASAGAQQSLPSNSMANRQNDRPGGAPPPQEKHAPRANEKDYKSSLGRLPDKKYDPWANTR
jgi:hypothetical protein